MTKKLIYGPVPSRRLGFSLGVDLVPYKICSYNCIYCQIGPTPETTLVRKPYFPGQVILDQVAASLKKGVQPDYITLGGSGEPTLNSDIRGIIQGIKAMTDIPVAVITNGSLLGDRTAREDLAAADVVLPSLDASSADMFAKINRPHPDLAFEKTARGLIEFRKIYPGRIWLEIFIVKGINDTAAAMKGFKYWTDQCEPDKIHLNTAVRPTAEQNIGRVAEDDLTDLCRILGDHAEVVAAFNKHRMTDAQMDTEQEILDMLGRRPCTLADIAGGLGLHQNEVIKYVEPLVTSQALELVRIDSTVFYRKL